MEGGRGCTHKSLRSGRSLPLPPPYWSIPDVGPSQKLSQDGEDGLLARPPRPGRGPSCKMKMRVEGGRGCTHKSLRSGRSPALGLLDPIPYVGPELSCSLSITKMVILASHQDEDVEGGRGRHKG